MANTETSSTSAPAKKSSGGGISKIIWPVVVLGGLGMAAYWAYERFAVPVLDAPAAPPRPSGPQPNLRGPRVTKGELASTKSSVCISQQDPRMRYAPVISFGTSNYKNFQSPVNGHFTGRLLCQGGKSAAEIWPHV